MGEGWDSLLGGGRILQQVAVELRSPPTLLLRGFRVPEAEAAGGSRAGPGGGTLVPAARRPSRALPGGKRDRAHLSPPVLGAGGAGTPTFCTAGGIRLIRLIK